MYDNRLLRIAVSVFAVLVLLIVAVFQFFTWLTYPKKNAYEEEMEAKEKKEGINPAVNPIPLMERADANGIEQNPDGEIHENVNVVKT